jgi:hypothetical protein
LIAQHSQVKPTVEPTIKPTVEPTVKPTVEQTVETTVDIHRYTIRADCNQFDDDANQYTIQADYKLPPSRESKR